MDVTRVIDILNGAHRWSEEARLNISALPDGRPRDVDRMTLNSLVTLRNAVLALTELVRQLEPPPPPGLRR